MFELKEGAVLVADAHYASYRPAFSKLIDKLLKGEIQTSQLILMGDIFDLLMGPISAFTQPHKKIIDDLNFLSDSMEIVFLEGNHDYQLAKLFPKMKVYTLSEQPLAAKFKDKEGYLAHGDWHGDIGYKIYTSIIRSNITLYSLNFLDAIFRGRISQWLIKKMQKKVICSKFDTFEAHIINKFKKSNITSGWFIEGHYHQGSSFFIDEMFYQNLDAMACNKSYFVVQSNKYDVELTAFTL